MPLTATFSISSPQIASTSPMRPGWQPAYTPNTPVSAYCDEYEYTE